VPRIDSILQLVQAQGASDLHLVSGSPPMLRLHGELQPIEFEPLTSEVIVGLLAEIMTEEQIARFQNLEEVDFAYEVPQVVHPGWKVSELGGNVVIIDIGGGVFAYYAHLAPGSPTVKVGDKVRRGQVIGTLGNSGNTSEAHLHFQLSTSAASLTGDNVPFEIDTLTLVGNYPGGVYAAGPEAGPRTNQLPLIASLVSFPPAP